MQIGNIERVRLANLPTPLQELSRLSKLLGGPRLFVKRDDLTGLGMGGNKLRKLEYAMADAVRHGATVLITVGGPQSNHVRLTTAAANRLGLKTILLLRGERPQRITGNLLIDHLLGAEEIHFIGGDGFPPKGMSDPCADRKAQEIADRLTEAGEVPYIIPNGCKALHGALGYAGCVLELITQLREQHLAPSTVVTACGTSGTQTGLILGSHLYSNDEIEVLGVSVATERASIESRIRAQLEEVRQTLGLAREIPSGAVEVLDEYVGSGYGIPTEAMREAVSLVARSEGIVIDPVYTGKAMAGLIAQIRAGRFGPDDIVVFLHTGGTPALFADAQIESFAQTDPPL